MRALAILHEPDGPAGEVGNRLIDRGFEIDEHVVVEHPGAAAPPFPDHTTYDLLVVLGSVQSLTDRSEIEPWISEELEWLADAHHANTPILGICFGGQLLAEALGGRVERSPTTEIGWFAMDPTLAGPAGIGPWFQWHHDRFEAPPDSELLARNATSQQLFRMGRTVGTQFHPEVNPQHVKDWLTYADQEYLDQHGVDPSAVMVEMEARHDANVAQCQRFVDWYLDHVAHLGNLDSAAKDSGRNQ